MKQRLGIAAAVMGNPDVIILDEPTNALDENGINNLDKIIKSERERGALLIITCHDSCRLKQWCDVIINVENGRIANILLACEK